MVRRGAASLWSCSDHVTQFGKWEIDYFFFYSKSVCFIIQCQSSGKTHSSGQFMGFFFSPLTLQNIFIEGREVTLLESQCHWWENGSLGFFLILSCFLVLYSMSNLGLIFKTAYCALSINVHCPLMQSITDHKGQELCVSPTDYKCGSKI